MNMLRSIREKKGLTVSQLAARASISARVITEYEEGRQVISLSHAKLIAKALWVPIEDLMPPAGSAPPPPVGAGQAPVQPQPRQVLQAPHIAAPVVAPTAVQSTPLSATNSSSQVAQPARHEAARPAPQTATANKGAEGGTTRPSRSVLAPPGPITEGQVTELLRIATRLEIAQDQLEQRIGKSLHALNRPEAKEWIKRLRAMSEEIAPSGKVRFGQWPEEREDQEATYLREQREMGSHFMFKLFNGDQFSGTIADFTPYTITINLPSGEEMVLRKLAIAYYRRLLAKQATNGMAEERAMPAEVETGPKPARAKTRKAKKEEEVDVAGMQAHEHTRDDHHQPLDHGIDSDHVGEPVVPEEDSMDDDRGV